LNVPIIVFADVAGNIRSPANSGPLEIGNNLVKTYMKRSTPLISAANPHLQTVALPVSQKEGSLAMSRSPLLSPIPQQTSGRKSTTSLNTGANPHLQTVALPVSQKEGSLAMSRSPLLSPIPQQTSGRKSTTSLNTGANPHLPKGKS
jgi:hypothetical protein